MHKVSARRRALGFRRSLAGLDARGGSLINLPPPVDSIPIVGPLATPLVDNGAEGDEQPSTSSDPATASSSAGDSGSGSSSGGEGVLTSTTLPTSGGGTTVPPASTGSGSSMSPTPSSSWDPGFDGPNSFPPPPSPGGSSSSYGASGGNTANPLGAIGSGNTVLIQGSFTTTAAALDTATPAAVSTGFTSSSQSSQVFGSNIAGTAAASSLATAISASRKQLSGGVITGITIACLFSLLVLILLVVRHRSIARRIELRKHWWFNHNVSGGGFSLVSNGSSRSRVGPYVSAPASRSSSRSSFATNFDQGLMFHVDPTSRLDSDAVPDLPPMAEVRDRNSVLISAGSAVVRRGSMSAMLSDGSEPAADVQYLSIPAGQNNAGPFNTPMSALPFSPSEPLSFPKPPPPWVPIPDSFVSRVQETRSSQSSTSTLVHLSAPPRAFMTDLPPMSVSAPSLHPGTATPTLAVSQFIVSSDASIHPFADPVQPEFAEAGVICHAFTPSLDDEVAVCSGDRVLLLQMYDDGWAFIEKLAGIEGGRHERGLIPIDCFHGSGQALPTYLPSKRVSTYGDYQSDEQVGTAL